MFRTLTIREIERKIGGYAALQARFRPLLILSHRVLTQEQRQRGRKVYALHAPEVECSARARRERPESIILEALRARLMQPDLVAEFAEAWQQEVNRRLRRQTPPANGPRASWQVERKRAGLVEAISCGLRAPSLQQQRQTWWCCCFRCVPEFGKGGCGGRI